MAITKGLLKRLGKYRDGIYPYTQTDCVFDENGNSLDGILSNINTNKQNTLIAGRGIGITGNTINNNFESLIGDATIATGDKLVIRDASNSNNLAGSSITFGNDDRKFLTNSGKFARVGGEQLYSASYNPNGMALDTEITIPDMANYNVISLIFSTSYGSGNENKNVFAYTIPTFLYSYYSSNTFRFVGGENYRTFRLSSTKITFVGGNNKQHLQLTRVFGII